MKNKPISLAFSVDGGLTSLPYTLPRIAEGIGRDSLILRDLGNTSEQCPDIELTRGSPRRNPARTRTDVLLHLARVGECLGPGPDRRSLDALGTSAFVRRNLDVRHHPVRVPILLSPVVQSSLRKAQAIGPRSSPRVGTQRTT